MVKRIHIWDRGSTCICTSEKMFIALQINSINFKRIFWDREGKLCVFQLRGSSIFLNLELKVISNFCYQSWPKQCGFLRQYVIFTWKNCYIFLLLTILFYPSDFSLLQIFWKMERRGELKTIHKNSIEPTITNTSIIFKYLDSESTENKLELSKNCFQLVWFTTPEEKTNEKNHQICTYI